MILIRSRGQSSMEWNTLMMLFSYRNVCSLANKHAPPRVKRVKGSKTSWVISKLAELKRDKDYYLRKARTANSNYHWRMYKKLGNYSNHEERNLKSKYFCQMIEDAKNDGSEMWRALKQVFPDARKQCSPSLKK